MDAHDDELRRIEAAREAGEELDAFNAELSGIASGRMSRFLPADHESKPGAQERRAEKAQAQMNALESLLATDPLYRAAHQQALGTLQDMESRTESALVAVRREMQTVADTLVEMRERGSVLPDGRKVYLDDNGDAFTEEGEKIEGPELEGVIWRADAPRYDEIKAQREREAELQRRENAILRYQTDVLGHARERLTDKDNPASREEVEKLDTLMKDQADTALASEHEADQPEYGETSFSAKMPKP